MGLLQQAMKTYDSMSRIVGVTGGDGKEPLAPVGHITTKPQIRITIDADGTFLQAEAIDELKVIIPVTEQSAGRTSGICPHPICDQVGYITDSNQKKHSEYLQQLEGWACSDYSHPKVKAVFSYLGRNTVTSDLEKAGLLKIDEKGSVSNEKDLIVWWVTGLGEESGPIYTDQAVFRSWEEYYIHDLDQDGNVDFCYLTGEYLEKAKQHMKGVVSLNGNSKIISANDHVNFTYRGRFEKSDQAVSVSYIASQKAHNALKWVVANYGIPIGSRLFVAWNPDGHKVPSIINPMLPKQEERVDPKGYRKELGDAVKGYLYHFPETEKIVIAGFDAATSGRLAVTYYNELLRSDFLKRMMDWDNSCCWIDVKYGVHSPLLKDIVRFAYGTMRGEKDDQKFDVDERVMPEQMQRLIHCRIDRAGFPEDLMRAMVRRAGNLKLLSKKNRSRVVFAACAAIRKYHWDHNKEEWEMALNPKCQDRSYQFGRLLAIMEGIERSALHGMDDRETNAIRLQQVFVQRPGYAAATIMEKLKTAYYPRLNPGLRIYYERLVGEVMEMLSAFPQEDYNKPLEETYLMGYYLQKNEFYTKKSEDEEKEAE